MPAPHARLITLTVAERRRLTALAYSHTAAYQQVIRARIVCDAARGDSNAAIARRHELTVDTVRRWRGRFADEGLAGLTDRSRSGRPPADVTTYARRDWTDYLALRAAEHTETPKK